MGCALLWPSLPRWSGSVWKSLRVCKWKTTVQGRRCHKLWRYDVRRVRERVLWLALSLLSKGEKFQKLENCNFPFPSYLRKVKKLQKLQKFPFPCLQGCFTFFKNMHVSKSLIHKALRYVVKHPSFCLKNVKHFWQIILTCASKSCVSLCSAISLYVP